MKTVRTIEDVRSAVQAARAEGRRVAAVPTMGALHEGHLALVRHAAASAEFVVVTLFVNPTQFNDPADLERYPRDEARDASLAEAAGAHLLFAPSVAAVYPPGFATTVSVAGITETLEGAHRGAAHFHGVATVVCKLLNIIQPDVACFGQKDAQQALVVRRLVRDLDLPTAVAVVPTVRDADGLALSSRNVLLTAADRARAPALYRALTAIAHRISGGETDPAAALSAGERILAEAGIQAEYLVAVGADDLAPVAPLQGALLVAVAARLGNVRLIDNLPVTVPR